MQNVLYAGLRNPDRDQQIYAALLESSVSEVAEQLKLAPSTVKAAAKRITDLSTYNLRLIGGVRTSRLGQLQPSHSGGQRSAHIATSAEHSAAWS